MTTDRSALMLDPTRPPERAAFTPPYRLVVIAASKGGIQALKTIFTALPADFPVPILVAQHRAATSLTVLESFIGLKSALTVEPVSGRQVLKPGQVYLAPADKHLVVSAPGICTPQHGDKLHNVRPAADPLFSSAAQHYGGSVLGLVLTGLGRDGAKGAQALRQRGSIIIVQDPDTCDAPDMPRAVLGCGGSDFSLPLEAIAPALISLVMVPVTPLLFGFRPRAA